MRRLLALLAPFAVCVVPLAAVAAPAAAAVAPAAAAPSAIAARSAAAAPPVTTKVLARHLHVPWGLAFMPNGDGLVTERPTGNILRIPANGGKPQLVRTITDADPNAGEGGLLGIALSPTFKRDRLAYAYYTSREGGNRIVRFRLYHGPIQTILSGIQSAGNHNGGRIAFGPDGKLYAGVGEAGHTELAQDLSSLNGKILRINPDGSIPADNPFPGSPVWSYGHRNVQGLAWDRDGRLWATEFGQNTTDEVNLIEPGHDYGWPIVEGNGLDPAFTNPKVSWTPTATCSPSGDAIVGHRLYVAALAGHALFRIQLDGENAGQPVRLLGDVYGRLRTVAAAPGGGLWITTSNADGRGQPTAPDDRIIRIAAP